MCANLGQLYFHLSLHHLKIASGRARTRTHTHKHIRLLFMVDCDVLCIIRPALSLNVYLASMKPSSEGRHTDWIGSGLVSGYCTQDIIMVSHKIELKWSFIMNEETQWVVVVARCAFIFNCKTSWNSVPFTIPFQFSVPMVLNSRTVHRNSHHQWRNFAIIFICSHSAHSFCCRSLNKCTSASLIVSLRHSSHHGRVKWDFSRSQK